MTIKQKYDKALGRARELYAKGAPDSLYLEEIFPELKESEDEKIRKALLELVHDTTGDELWIDYNVHKEDALVWLEKQGEQKPVWSEEDERLLSKLQTYVDLECFDRECNGQDLINWLKSLKPQPHWKPSEVQMQQLGWVAKQNETNLIGKELTILYNDLKKLKE